jgi:hypothetical protein
MGLTVAAAARWLPATSAWEVLRRTPQDINGLDAFVMSASSTPASGAVGVFVEDSDYAYLVFASNGGRPGHLLIGSKAARDHQQGRAALERFGDQASKSSSLFLGWARTLGFDVPLAAVRNAVDREWTYAEDGVESLADLVGLRDLLGASNDELPGEATGLLGGKVRIPAVQSRVGPVLFRSRKQRCMDLSTTRYVAGYGNGFVGVWDRRNPAHPVRRFEPGQLALALRVAIELEADDRRHGVSDPGGSVGS